MALTVLRHVYQRLFTVAAEPSTVSNCGGLCNRSRGFPASGGAADENEPTVHFAENCERVLIADEIVERYALGWHSASVDGVTGVTDVACAAASLSRTSASAASVFSICLLI